MKKTQSFNAQLAARLDEKAAYVIKQVRELLGERYTQDDLQRALLFDAAWARVMLEDQRRETEKTEQLFLRATKIAEEAVAVLNKFDAANDNDVRNLTARMADYHALVERSNKKLLPLAEQGEKWITKQRQNGFRRFEADHHKHEDWRRQQAAEIAADPKFGRYSKQEQARRLKKKHCIPDKVQTIAKRLS